MIRNSIAIVFLLFASFAFATEPDPLIVAARTRQDRSKTVVIEYKQASTVTMTATPARPQSQATTSADNRIVLDGSKARVEDNNPAISSIQGFTRHAEIEVFDGKVSRTFFPKGYDIDPAPRHSSKYPLEPGLPDAVFLYFRGLDSSLRLQTLESLNPTGVRKAVDGKQCIEYEFIERNVATHYWIDPAKGFAVSRVESECQGKIFGRTMISYRSDAEHGWVPSGWRIENFNENGSPKFVRDTEVTRLVINGAVDPEEFHLKFKPGTHVQDQESKKLYVIGEDGNPRELTAEEMFGPQRPTPWWQRLANHTWMIVLVASILLSCLMPILIWRRSRNRSPKWDQLLDDL